MIINFEVKGEPVGKGRPRFTNVGGYPRAYTDKKTKDYEKLIAMSYRSQIGTKKFMEDEYLKISIDCYFKRQKYLTRVNTLLYNDHVIRPNKYPDIDNVVKSILDGLNGMAFVDDKQVLELSARKFYVEEDKEPRVEIAIERI